MIREQDIYPHLKKWIWDNDIVNVVDLGCGQGVCSTKLPENTAYTGIEPSPHLRKRAHVLYPETVFLEGSAYNIPLQNNSVDGVFSIAVWQLLSDVDQAAKEVSRVLKDGGHFFIVTADANHMAWKKASDRLYLRSENEIGDSLLKHGLKPTSMGAFRSFWFFEGRKI